MKDDRYKKMKRLMVKEALRGILAPERKREEKREHEEREVREK